MYTPPDGAEDAVPGEVIRSATWNTIFTDLSAALTQIGTLQVPSVHAQQASLALSRVLVVARGVNFSQASTDTGLSVVLPTGYTYWRPSNIQISAATSTITAATVGVFTSPVGGGVTVVASGTSTTITSTSPNVNNNMQALTILNGGTEAYNIGTIYLRVQTAQPGTVFANVSVEALLVS